MHQNLLQRLSLILLASLLMLAAIGHLTIFRTEFQAQVPDWIPMNKDLVVVLSGIVEFGFGAGLLLFTGYRVPLGIGLAIFFVLIVPGNINQYVEGINAFGLNTDRSRFVRLFFQPVLIFWALYATGALNYLIHSYRSKKQLSRVSFYDLEATSIGGKPVSMAEYKGNVVIVVNTASKCGLTPQYEGLEALYTKYEKQGLVVLGFPCNQFGHQEPGSSADIAEFCQLNYGVRFPMFSKVDVNGPHTHPLFAYLKSRLGGFLGRSIKWNFTKFVLDRNGKPVKRFGPTVKPEHLESTLQKLL